MEKSQKIIAGGAALSLATVAGLFSFLSKEKPKEKDLREKLVNVVLDLIPTEESIIAEPDPRWDWILGGKVAPDRWAYYQWAEHAKYGTTCGIFAAACMVKAGFPVELINRDPPEGSGYKRTWHIARIYEGATALSSKGQKWLFRIKDLDTASSDSPPLIPGDIYCQVRRTTWQGKEIDMEHVGIVLSCSKGKDGSWSVETADGGQTHPTTTRQCAKRNSRTLRGSSLKANAYGTEAKLEWIVRAPLESERKK